MRVIAGKYRSRAIRPVPGMDVRPTSDRLRETLFNVLAASQTLEQSVWVDLFAGTGAVGIEALSRGAASVCFVEKSAKVARVIADNLKSLDIAGSVEVLISDAVAGLRELERRNAAVDFVFLDPPYREEGSYEAVLRVLSNSPLLSPRSIVIAEHTKHYDPGTGVASLQRYRELKQGDAVLSFYRMTPVT